MKSIRCFAQERCLDFCFVNHKATNAASKSQTSLD